MRTPLLVLIVTLVATLTPGRAFAQARPPAEAIVWWSFDPTRFEHPGDEPTNAAFLPVLRAGVGSGLFGDGTEASILEALLALSEVGRAPHTFAVIDFAARRKDDDAGMDVERLQAVLELRTTQGHDRFLRTIKRIALDAPKAKDRSGAFEAGQFRIDLPGGRTAVALRDNADAEWEQLAWCSEDGIFTIGYGVGALERWFRARPAEAPAWDAHRALVDGARPEGDVVLEAYTNFDALRERFPDAFRKGRTPRMLRALGLEGASSAMFHGRFVDDAPGELPLLVFDHTREDWGEEGGEGEREMVAWTLDAWPDELPRIGRTSGATYALIASPEWPALVDRAIEIHNATIKDTALPKHMASVERWRERSGGALGRLLGALGSHLILTDAPQPPAPVPGLATVLAPIEGDAGVASRAMTRVLADFADRVRTTTDGGRTGWSYSIDSGGLIRLPVWSVVEREGEATLIGGWGRACLQAGERWLAQRVGHTAEARGE